MRTATVTAVVLVLAASIAILAVAWTWQHSVFGESQEQRQSKREMYVNSSTALDGAYDIVRDAFRTTLGRMPLPSEQEFYGNELESGRLNRQDIVTLLRIMSSIPSPARTSAPPGQRRAALRRQQQPTQAAQDQSKEEFAILPSPVQPEETTEDLIRSLYTRMFGVPPSNDLVSFIVANGPQDASKLRGFLLSLQTVFGNPGSPPPPSASKPSVSLTSPPTSPLSSTSSRPAPTTSTPRVSNCAYAAYASDQDKLYHGLSQVSTRMKSRQPPPPQTSTTSSSCMVHDPYAADLVLAPELKWSVPQKHSPVCIPVEKCPICPTTSQSSLIGTLLSDATSTKVGSILPRFTYAEGDVSQM